MVRAILADINIQGQVGMLLALLNSPEWRDLWVGLALQSLTLGDLGLPPVTSDADIWDLCQREQIVLLTANRNHDGPNSLEATLRARNTPDALPVFTLSDGQRILHSKEYAERVVVKLLEYLMDIDRVRGTGRLYLP